jgi:signal transduction histidine kinase
MGHSISARVSQIGLPNVLIWAVVVICALPYCLYLVGVDSSVQTHVFEVPLTPGTAPQEVPHAALHTLEGRLTQTLLEWTAFCTAIFTVGLAFAHYAIRPRITPLVIGIALLCAATMETCNTLLLGRLFAVIADDRNFMPFTWTVGRFFNGVIMIVGAGMCLVTRRRWHIVSGVVLLVSLACSGIAYRIIQVSASRGHVPHLVFPGALVPRPYDAVPLIVFLLAGTVIYPRLYRRVPSGLCHALVISTLPNVAAQLYMTLSSSMWFDDYCNLAYGLKSIAYLVLFSGLMLDYVWMFREEELAVHRLTESQEILRARSTQLERTNANLEQRNAELDEFTAIASHDLQEPVRKLIAFSHLLRRDLGPNLAARAAQDVHFIVDAATRMQRLIRTLLALSRVGKAAVQHDRVCLETCVDQVLDGLAMRVQETGATIRRDPLPTVWGDPTLVAQIYQNLIENALKFTNHGPPVLRLTAEQHAGRWILGVQDRGVGLKPEDAEHIFAPFTRLHSQAAYAGTGIGLTICRKAVELHGGRIWVEAQPDIGAHFKFTFEA